LSWSEGDWISFIPFLNSVILCPKERASDGNRLPKSNSTIARKINHSQMPGIQANINGSPLSREAMRSNTDRPRTYYQFYKRSTGSQTPQKADKSRNLPRDGVWF
jgi:hypothetical protein